MFSGLSHDCFLKGLLQSIGKYLRLTVVDELDDTQDRIFKAFSKACHSYQRGQFNIDSLKAVGKEKVFKFCPACPRNGGKMFLCLDGCFTSGRLTKAGKYLTLRLGKNHTIQEYESFFLKDPNSTIEAMGAKILR